MIFSSNNTRTSHIRLDTRQCKACWECLENCPGQVIGKVDLTVHKHALIVQPEGCTGCFRCIDTCKHHAYTRFDKADHELEKQRQRAGMNFFINNLLLFFGMAVVFSGLVLQIGFHMGGPHGPGGHGQDMQAGTLPYEQLRQIDLGRKVCGLTYPVWSDVHKLVVVCFSLLMIRHIFVHLKWYSAVITKHLNGRSRQVLILSVLFLAAAVTGFVPWFIDLAGSPGSARMLFIEIHDKITLLLILFFVLHIVKRSGWYAAVWEKIRR